MDLRPWSDFAPEVATGSLAIVGNAGYLADLEQGPLIDSHDRVLRLNNFRIEGHEKAVGRRIDGYMTNFYKDIDFGRPELAHCRAIFSSVPNNFYKRRRQHLHHRHAENIVHGMKALWQRTVYFPDMAYFHRQAESLSAFPSTGFMAVLFGLDFWPGYSLYLTGFSFFEGRSHYFRAGPHAPGDHDFARERAILRDRLSSGLAAGRVQVDPVMRAILFSGARAKAAP